MMAMMMTGRVLLVCALCVLWCEFSGIAADGADSSAGDYLLSRLRAQMRTECVEEVSRRTGDGVNASAVEECVRQGVDGVRAVVDGRRRWRHVRSAAAAEDIGGGVGDSGEGIDDSSKGSSPSDQRLHDGRSPPVAGEVPPNPQAEEETSKLSGDAIGREGPEVSTKADPAISPAGQKPKHDSMEDGGGTGNHTPPGTTISLREEEAAIVLTNPKGESKEPKVEKHSDGVNDLQNQEERLPQGKEQQLQVERKASDEPTGGGRHDGPNEKVVRAPVETKVNLTEIQQESLRTHTEEPPVKNAEDDEKEKEGEKRADGQKGKKKRNQEHQRNNEKKKKNNYRINRNSTKNKTHRPHHPRDWKQLRRRSQLYGQRECKKNNNRNSNNKILQAIKKTPQRMKTLLVQMPPQTQTTVIAAPRPPTPPPLFCFFLLLRVRLRLRWWPRESEGERAVHHPHTHSSFTLSVCPLAWTLVLTSSQETHT
ncbi:mucin-associated surface protein (MASP), putative [Trypanosoma cruzi marinkellei]|uniref:Mucin-associated surface protein (MASP), putative n=1 Tax=Trypanosoma cruzi marinkellei TaxID=85056 RepID=K2MUL5_TRYCR|nr:mucin-associated surface protein (MASP), putative [Trypanosoma cruzi marinkellei]